MNEQNIEILFLKENEILFKKIICFSHKTKFVTYKNMPQGYLATHNYEDSSMFLAMPSGTATRTTSTESQGTPKIELSMSGYFHFLLKLEFRMNAKYVMGT